ncbi:GNAT family N-acetyltransferase [Nonomuraea sp. NPDC046802]|uniref:GNAT family N-acetyltransferase n=1 Tax=Nonomuraea sp. NPDC046802 TaxID=3154919 RepID=UPI0033ED96CE
MTQNITIKPYQPGTGLDEELAGLGYSVMCGWPDQRPVTPSLVRSRLRPIGDGPPTRLVLARDQHDQLIGAAALRHPAARGAPARLWGPVVAQDQQRRGLGTRLLKEATALWSPSMPVLTAEIPATRAHGGALYERANWNVHSEAVLMKGPAAAPSPRPVFGVVVRPACKSDAGALSHLYETVRPGQSLAVAAGTWNRWCADERFVPDGLLVCVPAGKGDLLAAALAYPLAHSTPDEPPEVLIADVLIRPGPGRASVAGPLIRAAIASGVQHGAHVIRAIVPEADQLLIDDLSAAGLTPVETIRYYQAPMARSTM